MKESKIKLWRVKNVVSFQILELNNFTDYRGKGLLYEGKDGFHIYSDSSPSLNPTYIDLAGKDKRKDHKVSSMDFDTDEQAEKYVTRLATSLKEWESENGFQIKGGKKPYNGFFSDYGFGNHLYEDYMDEMAHQYIQEHGNPNDRESNNRFEDHMDEMMIRYESEGYGRIPREMGGGRW